jgi:hypothetical protein
MKKPNLGIGKELEAKDIGNMLNKVITKNVSSWNTPHNKKRIETHIHTHIIL